jgi:hypothetical protein
MYNSLAGAPTSVNEQLTKQKTAYLEPDCPDEVQVLSGLLVSEVDEAEAAELPELVPVSLFHVQAITITLDAEFVRRFR